MPSWSGTVDKHRLLLQNLHQPGIPGESLPELINAALAGDQDFIFTAEADPDTGSCSIHAFSGKFIVSYILRKLLGLAEAERNEGRRVITGEWK